jgi:ABC-type branched-subunit amino acid transport system substrate-binding protein
MSTLRDALIEAVNEAPSRDVDAILATPAGQRIAAVVAAAVKVAGDVELSGAHLKAGEERALRKLWDAVAALGGKA